MLGCALTQDVVLHQARKRHDCRYFTRIEAACLSDRAVYVQLELSRPNAASPQSAVLRVPLDDPEWPQSGQPDRLVMYDDYWGRHKLRHVPVTRIQTGETVPADARRIPIRSVTLERDAELDVLLGEGGEGVQVYAVTHIPDPDSYEFPLSLRCVPDASLARKILVVQDTANPLGPLVALDVYGGYSRQWGWYLLLPVSVAADVVTAPLQILVVLIAS